MQIITRKRLNDFAETHPDAKSALQHWYRLAKSIAAIHYNRRSIYIRAVLTHRDYDEGKWKE